MIYATYESTSTITCMLVFSQKKKKKNKKQGTSTNKIVYFYLN